MVSRKRRVALLVQSTGLSFMGEGLVYDKVTNEFRSPDLVLKPEVMNQFGGLLHRSNSCFVAESSPDKVIERQLVVLFGLIHTFRRKPLYVFSINDKKEMKIRLLEEQLRLLRDKSVRYFKKFGPEDRLRVVVEEIHDLEYALE
ncbi:hypothetical protein PG989_013229 [Apiospora arundinis]